MGLVAPLACGIFPDQGLNSCLLHWQMDSSPLNHQGSPGFEISILFVGTYEVLDLLGCVWPENVRLVTSLWVYRQNRQRSILCSFLCFSMWCLLLNFVKDASALICLFCIPGLEDSDLLGGEYPRVRCLSSLYVYVSGREGCDRFVGIYCKVSDMFRSEFQQVMFLNSFWVYVPGFESSHMFVSICASVRMLICF